MLCSFNWLITSAYNECYKNNSKCVRGFGWNLLRVLCASHQLAACQQQRLRHLELLTLQANTKTTDLGTVKTGSCTPKWLRGHRAFAPPTLFSIHVVRSVTFEQVCCGYASCVKRHVEKLLIWFSGDVLERTCEFSAWRTLSLISQHL